MDLTGMASLAPFLKEKQERGNGKKATNKGPFLSPRDKIIIIDQVGKLLLMK